MEQDIHADEYTVTCLLTMRRIIMLVYAKSVKGSEKTEGLSVDFS